MSTNLLGGIDHDERHSPRSSERDQPARQGIGPLERTMPAVGAEVFPTQAKAVCRPRRHSPRRSAGRPVTGSENAPVRLAEDGNGGRHHPGRLRLRLPLLAWAAGGPPCCQEPVFKQGRGEGSMLARSFQGSAVRSLVGP